MRFLDWRNALRLSTEEAATEGSWRTEEMLVREFANPSGGRRGALTSNLDQMLARRMFWGNRWTYCGRDQIFSNHFCGDRAVGHSAVPQDHLYRTGKLTREHEPFKGPPASINRWSGASSLGFIIRLRAKLSGGLPSLLDQSRCLFTLVLAFARRQSVKLTFYTCLTSFSDIHHSCSGA